GLEATVKTMEIQILPSAPESATLIWEDAAKEFTGSSPQLGDLGRLAFATLGWEELDPSSTPLSRNGSHGVVEAPIERVAALAEAPIETDPDPPVEDPASELIEEVVAEEIEPPAAPEPIPSVVTKPLPMTLHGHAPGRGKAVQVFPSAI